VTGLSADQSGISNPGSLEKHAKFAKKTKQKKHAHNLLQFPAEINTIVGVKQTQTNLIFFLFTKKNII